MTIVLLIIAGGCIGAFFTYSLSPQVQYRAEVRHEMRKLGLDEEQISAVIFGCRGVIEEMRGVGLPPAKTAHYVDNAHRTVEGIEGGAK